MYVLVWRFRARPGTEVAFRAAYGPTGAWAKLFARSPGFVAVELLAATDGSGDWLTMDRWRSGADHFAFKHNFAEAYATLDRECEALTEAETPLGAFDSVG